MSAAVTKGEQMPSELDLLKLENLELKLQLIARTFNETKAERDALKAAIAEEMRNGKCLPREGK